MNINILLSFLLDDQLIAFHSTSGYIKGHTDDINQCEVLDLAFDVNLHLSHLAASLLSLKITAFIF